MNFTMTRRGGRITGHAIRWYVWAHDSQGRAQRMPRESTMRGQWGYDVECECGWKSRTGGAVLRYVEGLVWNHKYDVQGGYD